MKTMPIAFAREVYVTDYWNALELDAVIEYHPLLADALMDCGVNAGVGRASEWLQRLLNVNNNKQEHYKDIRVDGDIGPATLRALKGFYNVRGDRGVKVLLAGLLCLKGNHYIECTEKREKNETFAYGWLDHRIFKDMNTYMDLID
jgi:lysozyme family protein